MSTYIVWSWERYEPVIESLKMSELGERPQLGDWPEYLYREVMKVEPRPLTPP